MIVLRGYGWRKNATGTQKSGILLHTVECAELLSDHSVSRALRLRNLV